MRMEPFTDRVITIIKAIPYGQVTTYGIIAVAAGNPGGARQVARILHSSSTKHNLPWHRVVNAKGEISIRKSMSHLTQRELLEKECVYFDKTNKIDFTSSLWLP